MLETEATQLDVEGEKELHTPSLPRRLLVVVTDATTESESTTVFVLKGAAMHSYVFGPTASTDKVSDNADTDYPNTTAAVASEQPKQQHKTEPSGQHVLCGYGSVQSSIDISSAGCSKRTGADKKNEDEDNGRHSGIDLYGGETKSNIRQQLVAQLDKQSQAPKKQISQMGLRILKPPSARFIEIKTTLREKWVLYKPMVPCLTFIGDHTVTKLAMCVVGPLPVLLSFSWPMDEHFQSLLVLLSGLILIVLVVLMASTLDRTIAKQVLLQFDTHVIWYHSTVQLVCTYFYNPEMSTFLEWVAGAPLNLFITAVILFHAHC